MPRISGAFVLRARRSQRACGPGHRKCRLPCLASHRQGCTRRQLFQSLIPASLRTPGPVEFTPGRVDGTRDCSRFRQPLLSVEGRRRSGFNYFLAAFFFEDFFFEAFFLPIFFFEAAFLRPVFFAMILTPLIRLVNTQLRTTLTYIHQKCVVCNGIITEI